MLEDNLTKLWHMRPGHMSENGSRRGLKDGQKTSNLYFCEHCIFGKQKQVRFSLCETLENPNFRKNGKTVISVEKQEFF